MNKVKDIAEELLVCAGVQTIINVILKQTDKVSWSWIDVFSPLWVYVSVYMLVFIATIIMFKIKIWRKKDGTKRNAGENAGRNP